MRDLQAEVQAALDYYDTTDRPPMPPVDPLAKAARMWLNPNIKSAVRAYDEAPIPMLKEDFVRRIVAAALTPGDTK